MSIQGWFPLGLTGLISFSPRDSQESSSTPWFKSISSSVLSFLYNPTLTSIHDSWKNHSFDYTIGSLGQALIQYNWCSYRMWTFESRKKITHGEHHVRRKEEIRVMHLRVKECQRLPANHQELGERHGQILLHSPGQEPTLLKPSSQASSLQGCEMLNFC